MTALTALAEGATRRGAALLALGFGTVLLGVLSVRSPVLSLGAVAGVAFVIVAFRSLAVGTALFVALTFFNLFPAGGGTASFVKMAGFVLIVAWLPELAQRGTLVPSLFHEHPLIALPLVGLAGWAFLSAAWAVDASIASATAARLLQGIVLVFIFSSAIRDRAGLRLVCWGYVAGAAVTAVVGLAGASRPEQVGAFTDTSRLSGNIGDPNTFAAILLPAFWIAAFGMPAARNPLGRWLLLTATVLIAVSIFYTQSRGGLIGLGLTLLAAPFLAGRARGRTVAAALLVAAVGLVYYVVIAPPQAIQRITHFTAEGGTGRTDAWNIALQIYGDHPLTGIGFGNFNTVEPTRAAGNTNLVRPDLIVDTPIVVHNTYLHVLTELGPLGLILLAVILIGTLTLAVRAIRQLQAGGYGGTEMLGRGMVIGTLGMLASITFLSAQSQRLLWMLVAMLLTLPAVARSVPTGRHLPLASRRAGPIQAAAR